MNMHISVNDVAVYIMIFIFCIWLAGFFTISLTILVFLIVGLAVIYWLYKSKKQSKITEEFNTESTGSLDETNTDIIDFLSEIKSYSTVNQTEYASLVMNIDNFIQLYNQVMYTDLLYCADNVQVAIMFYERAKNNLASMIYNLSSDPATTKLFHVRSEKFKSIMESYQSRLVTKCNKLFVPKLINNQSKYLDVFGPKPWNYDMN